MLPVFEPIAIQVLYKHFSGGLRFCLFCLFWGVQNLGKPAYIILGRSPKVDTEVEKENNGGNSSCYIVASQSPNGDRLPFWEIR